LRPFPCWLFVSLTIVKLSGVPASLNFLGPKYMKKLIATAAFAAAVSAAGVAGAAQFVTNGDFTTLTNGLGQMDAFTQATGWTSTNSAQNAYNFVMANGTAGSNGQDGNVALWTAANGGANTWNGLAALSGNFVALDDDFQVGALTQTISNLVIGQTYTFSYEYAFAQQLGFNGPTVQSLEADIGPDFSQNSGNVDLDNHAFIGWQTAGGTFTATQTSETLSFLATGSPQVPPFALVSNVSITGGVPEPAAWAMMLLGFGGLGALARSRARRLAAGA
jgi:PEP-CTERM motif